MKVSVVICSHNSRLDVLQRVLAALRAQRLPTADWELAVVDNGSREPLAPKLDLAWHSQGRVVRNDVPEAAACLVDARSLGIRSTTGEVIVFVDDDNVLAPDYLQVSAAIAAAHPRLGAWGGSIRLLYEEPELRPPAELEGLLCFRDIQAPLWSNIRDHHDSTPWGAGLCARRTVAEAHLARIAAEPDRRQLDPTGREMRFGGDTDLVYTGLLLGYGKGVFPSLHVTHLIPPRRCEIPYLLRALEANAFSAALHGWIDTGVVNPPRTDLRYYGGELYRWFRRNRWQRLIERMHRRGYWRAYRTLRGTQPRRNGPGFQPNPILPQP